MPILPDEERLMRLRQSKSPVPLTAEPEPYDAITLTSLHAQAPCIHCGGLHAIACPRVRRIRLRTDGSLEEVEFWRDWLTDRVIWKEDLPALPEA